MSLVRLGFELGMAASDYNSGVTSDHSEIIKTIYMYLDKVKSSSLGEEELTECYTIIGHLWAGLNPTLSTESTPRTITHTSKEISPKVNSPAPPPKLSST
jgi:hypothetical protein